MRFFARFCGSQIAAFCRPAWIMVKQFAKEGNIFMGIGKQVAMSHVRAEQMKGWFLANAKLLLVLLSGSQLFLGVVALAWGDRPAAFDPGLLSVVPAAMIGGLLAVCIEGGTLFSSAFHMEVTRKVRQEL